MSLLRLHDCGGYLTFLESECRAAGRSLSGNYQSAAPFPHIVIDELIQTDLLREVVAQSPSSLGKRYFDRDQERLKYQYHPAESDSPLIRNIFSELNSQAFLRFLEELTGIKGLIADPYFSGGGIHETKRGGHLSIHADFNLHDEMQVERRLNLIIYLNEDWENSFGGNLELWDKGMSNCAVSVAPLLGKTVIFSTRLDSYHGHPEPLACPPDRSRRSLATYYYTALDRGLRSLPVRTTNFRVRPGTSDRTDWRTAGLHVINDWVPPRLQGFAQKIWRRIAPQ